MEESGSGITNEINNSRLNFIGSFPLVPYIEVKFNVDVVNFACT
jgi:hypothetical protein